MKSIVSFSGGKDSTAMLIRMLEIGMKVDQIVFADTMYEFPDMYEYINKVNKYIKRFGDYNIEIIKTNEKLEEWMFGEITRGNSKGEIRGFPLTAYPCYWSRESKYKILDKQMKGHIRYIGIAVDEKNRMVKDYYERGYRYPLVEWGWTEDYCIEYLKEKDLHNPLYDKFDRLGCWWCPKQSLNSLEVLINEYPEKWRQLKEWDKQIRDINPKRQFKPNNTLDDIELKLSRRK